MNTLVGFPAPPAHYTATPVAAPAWTVFASNAVGVRLYRTRRLSFVEAEDMAISWRAAGFKNARPEVWPEGLRAENDRPEPLPPVLDPALAWQR